MSDTLAIGGGVGALAALVFFQVGRAVGDRDIEGDGALAVRLFQVWWFALAAVTLAGALQVIAAAGGFISLPIMLTLTQVSLLAITVALWGLMYYMTYLFVGSRRALVPLSVFYLLVYVLLAYFVSVGDPQGVEVGRWTVSVDYAAEPSGPLTSAVVGAILLPQIAAALALFGTTFRLEDRSQRYRAGIVSVSIFLWFGSSLAASAGGLSEQDWWQLASRSISLLASLAILTAYRPPRWVQRHWNVKEWASA